MSAPVPAPTAFPVPEFEASSDVKELHGHSDVTTNLAWMAGNPLSMRDKDHDYASSDWSKSMQYLGVLSLAAPILIIFLTYIYICCSGCKCFRNMCCWFKWSKKCNIRLLDILFVLCSVVIVYGMLQTSNTLKDSAEDMGEQLKELGEVFTNMNDEAKDMHSAAQGQNNFIVEEPYAAEHGRLVGFVACKPPDWQTRQTDESQCWEDAREGWSLEACEEEGSIIQATAERTSLNTVGATDQLVDMTNGLGGDMDKMGVFFAKNGKMAFDQGTKGLALLFVVISVFGILSINITCCSCFHYITMLLAFVALLVASVLVSVFLVVSVAAADTCYNDPVISIAQLFNETSGDAELISFYLNCEGIHPFNSEFEVMNEGIMVLGSADVDDEGAKMIRDKRSMEPEDGILGTLFEDVVNEEGVKISDGFECLGEDTMMDIQINGYLMSVGVDNLKAEMACSSINPILMDVNDILCGDFVSGVKMLWESIAVASLILCLTMCYMPSAMHSKYDDKIKKRKKEAAKQDPSQQKSGRARV